MKRLQNWSFWALAFLATCGPAHALNLYLRSDNTTCIYNGSSSQTLQKTSGSTQFNLAFSAKTNTFAFYTAVLTNSAVLSSSRTLGGSIGVKNNGSADFTFTASEVAYDYNPTNGSQVQIVATTTSGNSANVTKNGGSAIRSVPSKSIGGSGYTVPAGHMVKIVITVTVSINSGINGALIYNAPSG